MAKKKKSAAKKKAAAATDRVNVRNVAKAPIVGIDGKNYAPGEYFELPAFSANLLRELGKVELVSDPVDPSDDSPE